MNKYILFTLSGIVIGCTQGVNERSESVEVDQSTLGKHIEILASDDFMGRVHLNQ